MLESQGFTETPSIAKIYGRQNKPNFELQVRLFHRIKIYNDIKYISTRSTSTQIGPI